MGDWLQLTDRSELAIGAWQERVYSLLRNTSWSAHVGFIKWISIDMIFRVNIVFCILKPFKYAYYFYMELHLIVFVTLSLFTSMHHKYTSKMSMANDVFWAKSSTISLIEERWCPCICDFQSKDFKRKFLMRDNYQNVCDSLSLSRWKTWLSYLLAENGRMIKDVSVHLCDQQVGK